MTKQEKYDEILKRIQKKDNSNKLKLSKEKGMHVWWHWERMRINLETPSSSIEIFDQLSNSDFSVSAREIERIMKEENWA